MSQLSKLSNFFTPVKFSIKNFKSFSSCIKNISTNLHQPCVKIRIPRLWGSVQEIASWLYPDLSQANCQAMSIKHPPMAEGLGMEMGMGQGLLCAMAMAIYDCISCDCWAQAENARNANWSVTVGLSPMMAPWDQLVVQRKCRRSFVLIDIP